MKKILLGVVTAALAVSTLVAAQGPGSAASAVAGVPVIPRSALFGNPEKAQARVSPDGKYISFIAPRDGVLNVWLAERGKLDAAKPITNDQKRGIRQHYWAYDNRHVIYAQDADGDENWHLYAVDIVSGTEKDITPYKGARADLVDMSWKKPGVAAVALNDRNPEYQDLWEVDVATGQRTLIEQNNDEMAGYFTDLDLKPKLAQKNTAEGSEIFRRVGNKWVSLFKIAQEDSLTTAPLAIEADGKTAIVQSSIGRDKAAVVRVDIESGKTTVRFERARGCGPGVVRPEDGEPAGVHVQLHQARHHRAESLGEEGRRPADQEPG